MRSKFVINLTFFLFVMACGVPVNPAYKIGEQNGQPIYSVPTQTHARMPKASEAIIEANVLGSYCPKGSTVISRSGKKPNGKMTTFMQDAGNRTYVYKLPELVYDLKFVCKL